MSCMKEWVKKGSTWTLKHTRYESSLTVRTETILPRRTQSRARRSRFLRNSCWAIFRCTSSKAFVSLYHHASSAWPVKQNNHLKWSQYNYYKSDSFAALMIQKKVSTWYFARRWPSISRYKVWVRFQFEEPVAENQQKAWRAYSCVR